MILPTPGPVTTRPKVREALRHDGAPLDNDILTFHADSPARDAMTGAGIHQRKAA